MSESKKLGLLHEKHFVFLDGQISVRYYNTNTDKLSLRDLSEMFSGDNEYLPDVHMRAPSPDCFELYFFETGGYERLSFEQFCDFIRSPKVNNGIFEQSWSNIPIKAAIQDKKEDIRMCLCLDVAERSVDKVTLRWYVSAETEATTSMLRFLISTAYRNGMIRDMHIEKMANLS